MMLVEALTGGPRLRDFRQVAAHADVDKRRVRPQLRADPPGAHLRAGRGIGLDECPRGHLHRLHSLRADRGDAGLVDQPEPDHLPRHPVQRVASPPRGLFFLRPVAERGPGVRTVLVEEPVDKGLDDDRSLPGAEPFRRLRIYLVCFVNKPRQRTLILFGIIVHKD